jgi:hypothetical protein
LLEDTLQHEVDAETYEFGLAVLASDTRSVLLVIATFLNIEVQMKDLPANGSSHVLSVECLHILDFKCLQVEIVETEQSDGIVGVEA